MRPGDPDIVFQSYGRCCNRDTFFVDFYDFFMSSSDAIRNRFVDTDMARKVTDFPPADMTRSADIANMVSLALTLPNSASMAELSVNCTAEDQY